MPTPRSLVVYRGPSVYDVATTIRVVLVLRSSNRKTGPMAQLHILVDDEAPQVCQRNGRDAAVCGSCPLRPALGGGCYVVTCQGPLSTWRATSGQPVAAWSDVVAALAGRSLRLGAYGDPAAVPAHLVASLSAAVDYRVTGYTHGWRARPDLARVCMASVHSWAEAREAHAAGWRTFRARPAGAPLARGEVECLSESKGLACADCLLCRGTSTRAKSVAIQVHGTSARKALRVVA